MEKHIQLEKSRMRDPKPYVRFDDTIEYCEDFRTATKMRVSDLKVESKIMERWQIAKERRDAHINHIYEQEIAKIPRQSEEERRIGAEKTAELVKQIKRDDLREKALQKHKLI